MKINPHAQPPEAESPFEFACPTTKGLMRVDEVAAALSFDRATIYNLILEGRLEAHRKSGGERTHFRVTRRSVVAYLASTALYTPGEIIDLLARVATTLSLPQRRALVERLTR